MASNSSAPSQGQGLAPSLPRAGHVSQLKNNWRVFEDEAMALQMQHEEINHHYAGNRNRNQQIRADLPQAKQIQNQEAEAAHQEMEKYRLEMSSQAIADERVALEVALRQRGFLDDNEYTRRKDEMLAKSIEDIEKKYRKRNVEDFNPSTSYNDEEYRVQIAKPALITDEPLYANYQEEKFMNDVSLHSDNRDQHHQLRPASRSSQGQGQGQSQGIQRSQYNDSSQISPRNHIQDRPMLPEKNSYSSGQSINHQQVSPRSQENMEHLGSSSREPLSRRMAGSNMDREPSGASGNNVMVPPLQLSTHEGRISGPSSSRGPPVYSGGHSSAVGSRPVPSVPMPGGQVSSNPMPRGGSGSRPHSSLDANRVPPIEDLNTSSDYLTSRTSSRTSHRSDSSLTSHSEQGALSYAQGYGPVYGACGVTLPGTSQQKAQAALDRHKYNSYSSNDFDPMDSITPRRGVMDSRSSSRYGAEASSSPPSRRRGGGMDVGEELEVSGQLRGAVSLPVDEIGLRSALTPEEIRAAEAAEQLIEQERRDAELALRLQEELEMSDEGERAVEMDMKFAQEAQDREFARVLQAKEKARLRRAKEKARQKKLERQRLQQQQEETPDPDSIQYAPEAIPESLTPRDHMANDSQTRTQSRHSQLPGSPEDRVESRQQDRTESRQQDRAESRHDRTHSRISQTQVSPRGAGVAGSATTSPGTGTGLYSGGAPGVSSLSLIPEPDPPARKPYMHTQAIDSHINDTYCKTQITPTVSNSSSSVASSETSEPQYENLDKQGQPLKTEPILHLPSLKNSDKISPRQSAMNEDMPVPPYMPMQSSATRKSESMERKIKKKKEKEGCKQQ